MKCSNPRTKLLLPLLLLVSLFAFLYLLIGEFIPRALVNVQDVEVFFSVNWTWQEVVLLATLSFLTVSIASVGGCGALTTALWPRVDFHKWLSVINVAGLAASVLATRWSRETGNCPAWPYEGASDDDDDDDDGDSSCDYFSVLLDVVGVMSARLSRFDMALCLLLATRGDSAWLLRATGGWLALPEAILLHRTAGWWCVAQGGIHSVAYLVFYPYTGGLKSFWYNLLPTRVPGDELNRLGLVNFIGVAAFAAMLPLAVSALPILRARAYDVFQLLHLPVAVLFVLGCGLHDRPMLIFAIPGIADWYFGRLNAAARLLPATARLLPGTSGPWVELTVELPSVNEEGVSEMREESSSSSSSSSSICSRSSEPNEPSPRGDWALLRVLPLGTETHPFSVCVSEAPSTTNSTTSTTTVVSALIATTAGDWSKQLADLSRAEGEDGEDGGGTSSDRNSSGASSFQVELVGPFHAGAGDWSLYEEPALLLVAGGTGVFAWLTPALTEAEHNNQKKKKKNGRYVHLVWIVKTEGDYLALKDRLPPRAVAQVTVFVTRSAAGATAESGAAGGGDHLTAPGSFWDDEEGGGGTEGGNLASSESGESGSSGGGGSGSGGSDCWSGGDLLSMWASLAAAWAALAVGYWGWLRLYYTMEEPSTLLGYMVRMRVLPVALILATVGVVTVAGSYLLALARSASPLPPAGGAAYAAVAASAEGFDDAPKGHDVGGGATTVSTAPLLANVAGGAAVPPFLASAATAAQEGTTKNKTATATTAATAAASVSHSHRLRSGRPDVCALVHDAAAVTASGGGGGGTNRPPPRRLVVAACGPAALVRTTEHAVASARKEVSKHALQLVFSGTDSRW